MDLSYGEEYDRYRNEVRAFLSDNWPPKGAGQGALASGAGRSLSRQGRRRRLPGALGAEEVRRIRTGGRCSQGLRDRPGVPPGPRARNCANEPVLPDLSRLGRFRLPGCASRPRPTVRPPRRSKAGVGHRATRSSYGTS